MERFSAKINVKIKPSVKNVEAQTLEQAIQSILQLDELSCGTGNFYEISFMAENFAKAEEYIKTIASEILSNSVIEEYCVEWR